MEHRLSLVSTPAYITDNRDRKESALLVEDLLDNCDGEFHHDMLVADIPVLTQ